MLAENNIVTTINHSSNKTVYTLTDTVSNINLAINNLVYVTPTHWNGNDTMYFLLNDMGNVGNGGALYDTASISILIAAVDNPFTLDIPRKVAVEEGQQVLLPSFLLHDIDSFHSDFRVQIMVYCGYITMNTTNNLFFYIGDGAADSAVDYQGSYSSVVSSLLSMHYTSRTACDMHNHHDILNIIVTNTDNPVDTLSLSTVIEIAEVNNAPEIISSKYPRWRFEGLKVQPSVDQDTIEVLTHSPTHSLT
jgi:hypothetical protein